MSSLTNSDIQTDSVAVNSVPSVLFYHGNRIHEAEMLSRRLLTFKNYKGKKRQLAMDGFVYTGTSDKVVCESCGIRLFSWTGNEDPLQEHRKHTSGCSFIRAKFSTTGDSEYNKSDSTSSSTPKYREYESYDKSLESFIGWPLLSPLQKPSILARSGFFYMGSADRARCFHCGLTLRDWDDDVFRQLFTNDGPTNCEFADKLDIDEIRKIVEVEKSNMDSKNKTNVVEKSCDKFDTSCFVKPVNSVVAQATTTSDSSSSNYPHSPAVQAVLEMGYCIDLIEKAIDDRKRKVGSDFPDAVSLFEAVMEFIVVEKCCNYTYSPAIQAVLEMGYSIELIQKAIDNRKRKGGSDFPNAEKLFEAVLELEKKIKVEKSKMDWKKTTIVVEKSCDGANDSCFVNSDMVQATTTPDLTMQY